MVRGDTGASVKATRFGDCGRCFGDFERAAGEAGGMPSEKATRFGDLTECSSEPSETSEMWLRRRDGTLIASGAGGAPPAGATLTLFLEKIRRYHGVGGGSLLRRSLLVRSNQYLSPNTLLLKAV